MKKVRHVLIFLAFALLTTAPLFAQEAAPAEGAAPVAEETGVGFKQIVLEGGMVNTLIWGLIFLSSFAMIWFLVDGVMQTKRDKILPAHVVDGVRTSLDEGDLDGAIATCEQNPGPLSTILMAGFDNIEEGYEVVQESVGAATDLESEKLFQQINYLNLCGQIAPMLGPVGHGDWYGKRLCRLGECFRCGQGCDARAIHLHRPVDHCFRAADRCASSTRIRPLQEPRHPPPARVTGHCFGSDQDSS